MYIERWKKTTLKKRGKSVESIKEILGIVFVKCDTGAEGVFLDWINRRKENIKNGREECHGCKQCEEFSLLVDRFHVTSKYGLECSGVSIKYCSAFSGYFDFMIVLTAPSTPAIECFTLLCIRNSDEIKSVVKETQTVVGSIIVDFEESDLLPCPEKSDM